MRRIWRRITRTKRKRADVRRAARPEARALIIRRTSWPNKTNQRVVGRVSRSRTASSVTFAVSSRAPVDVTPRQRASLNRKLDHSNNNNSLNKMARSPQPARMMMKITTTTRDCRVHTTSMRGTQFTTIIVEQSRAGRKNHNLARSRAHGHSHDQLRTFQMAASTMTTPRCLARHRPHQGVGRQVPAVDRVRVGRAVEPTRRPVGAPGRPARGVAPTGRVEDHRPVAVGVVQLQPESVHVNGMTSADKFNTTCEAQIYR